VDTRAKQNLRLLFNSIANGNILKEEFNPKILKIISENNLNLSHIKDIFQEIEEIQNKKLDFQYSTKTKIEEAQIEEAQIEEAQSYFYDFGTAFSYYPEILKEIEISGKYHIYYEFLTALMKLVYLHPPFMEIMASLIDNSKYKDNLLSRSDLTLINDFYQFIITRQENDISMKYINNIRKLFPNTIL
jgi:hypothetical protein